MNLVKSAECNFRAKNSLVGGVNSPVRSFKRVGGDPIFASQAKGPWIQDVDSNQYIDFVMSYGPHLLGHANESIIRAVKKSLDNSFCFGMSSEAEIEWAELVLKRFAPNQKIRAMSSGTEACMTAVRLARGYTGRDLVVKFSGHYHGHVDSLLVDAGSGVATLSSEIAPDSKGLPASLCSLARVARFNDLSSVEKIFNQEGSKIAAIILEPIMGNMGVVPPKVEFLKGLAKLCKDHGALLIFDEVMTGLRVHEGSAQKLYGIEPDLTTLGKIIGGGLPLAALIGKAKIMDFLAPNGPVYQAGTLSGNPISISAGKAMLNEIDRLQPYEELEKISARCEELFKEALSKVPTRIQRVGSMFSVFFRSEVVMNAEDCRNVDLEYFSKYFGCAIESGIMLPPSPFEAYFVSLAHNQVIENELWTRLKKLRELLA